MSVAVCPAAGSLFGPVFRWEVVRISRRGLWHLVRLAFAIALLAYLYTRLGHRELNQNELSSYTAWITYVYYSLQRWVVVLLTPVLVCNAILDERRRQTLPLLMSSMLAAREIVLGKMIGRVLGLMTILITGVPVLALLQFLGGIDFHQAVYELGMAVLILLFLAMNSICYSARSKTLGSAVVLTYLQTGLQFVFGWLVTLPASLPIASYTGQSFSDVSGWCALGGGLIFAAWGVSRVIRSFHIVADSALLADHRTAKALRGWVDLGYLVSMGRSILGAPQDDWDVRVLTAPAKEEEEKHDVAIRYHRVPDVSDWPLYWKEVYFPMDRRIQWLLAGGSIALGAFAVLFVVAVAGTTRDPDSVRWLLRGLAYFTMMLVAGIVGLRAMASLADEYQQRSMELMMVWPWSSHRMLLEKGLGIVRRYRLLLLIIFVAVLPVIAVTMQGRVFWMLPIFAAQLCLLISLCMGVTIACRGQPMWSRGVVLGLVIASVTVAPYTMQWCWTLTPPVMLPADPWFVAQVSRQGRLLKRDMVNLEWFPEDTATTSIYWLDVAKVCRNALCPWEAWQDIVHVRFYWMRMPKPVTFATAMETNSPWWVHGATCVALLAASGVVFLVSGWLLRRRR